MQQEFEVLPDEDKPILHLRRTRPRLTRFERARVLSMRAEQIANGTQPFVEVVPGDSALDIAEREFSAGRTPFIVRRFVPQHDGRIKTEDWRLKELAPCDRRLSFLRT